MTNANPIEQQPRAHQVPHTPSIPGREPQEDSRDGGDQGNSERQLFVAWFCGLRIQLTTAPPNVIKSAMYGGFLIYFFMFKLKFSFMFSHLL